MELFGILNLLPVQKIIIEKILTEQAVLAVLPTGSGKSLCFQIPALLLPNFTVVITPLTSLGEDQVTSLNSCGIEAVVLHSGLFKEAETFNKSKLRSGVCKLVYMSPERFNKNDLEDIKSRISLL